MNNKDWPRDSAHRGDYLGGTRLVKGEQAAGRNKRLRTVSTLGIGTYYKWSSASLVLRRRMFSEETPTHRSGVDSAGKDLMSKTMSH